MERIYQEESERILNEAKSTASIRIDGKDWVVNSQIINNWLYSGKIIGSIWGSPQEIKKDIRDYEGKGYTFYISKVDNFYSVRIVDGYKGEYGSFLNEDNSYYESSKTLSITIEEEILINDELILEEGDKIVITEKGLDKKTRKKNLKMHDEKERPKR